MASLKGGISAVVARCLCSSSSYLLGSQGLVGVVELIGQDLPLAGEGRVPAEGHRGGGVGDRLQAGGGPRDLDWTVRETHTQEVTGCDPTPLPTKYKVQTINMCVWFPQWEYNTC